MLRCCGLTWVVAILAASVAVARAEVFVLANGGRVQGTWLNKEEKAAKQYEIRTATGGTLKLERKQVLKVYTPSPAELEYETIRDNYPETAEGQWELSEWCREHFLTDERKAHLERVIELDANHERARRALGYVRLDGEWKTEAQARREQGYVLYRGRWRLPEEVELLERRQQNKKETAAWFKKLKLWRNWLDDERAAEAAQNLVAIDDPNAVPALAQYFDDEAIDTVRILYIEALANVNTDDAVQVLGNGALFDPELEVRLTCLDYLKKEPRPQLVKTYVAGLKNKDNAIVNRSAYCLKELNDPSAVNALIDALVTTHKTKITSGGDNQYSVGFGGPSSGTLPGFGASPGGLSVGSSTKVIVQHLRNPEVLEALVALSGANFGYDAQSWKYWLASQKRDPDGDARRDAN